MPTFFSGIEKSSNIHYNKIMKKILYFTITYACIALFLFLVPSLNINLWLWLAIGIPLLILPIIATKLLKSGYNISKESIIAIVSVIFMLVFLVIFRFLEPPHDVLIAATNNPQKASQIQELLTTQKRETIRRYVYGENSESAEIGIFIQKISKNAFVDATMTVLTSPIMDDDVKLTLETKYTPNRKQLINNAEKALGNFIQNIDGVTHAQVAMKIGNYDSSPIDIKEVMVELETIDNADNTKIENLIKLYIIHTLPNVKPEQIKLYVNMS